MLSDRELRATTAHIVGSGMTRSQKVRSLILVRRQLKRFLRTIRVGISHLEMDCQLLGAHRLRATEGRIKSSVRYLGELIRSVAADGRSFGYQACGSAYPYSWMQGENR